MEIDFTPLSRDDHAYRYPASEENSCVKRFYEYANSREEHNSTQFKDFR